MTGRKKARHRAILRILQENQVHTQQQIAETLKQQGYPVSQSTLSKDFKALNVVKMAAADGSFRYMFPDHLDSDRKGYLACRELADFVLSYDYAGNLLVLKTAPGNAPGVGVAVDNLDWPELLGTIAGDDAVLLIGRNTSQLQAVIKRLEAIIR